MSTRVLLKNGKQADLAFLAYPCDKKGEVFRNHHDATIFAGQNGKVTNCFIISEAIYDQKTGEIQTDEDGNVHYRDAIFPYNKEQIERVL